MNAPTSQPPPPTPETEARKVAEQIVDSDELTFDFSGRDYLISAITAALTPLQARVKELEKERDDWKMESEENAKEWCAISDALGQKGKAFEYPMERIRDLIAKEGELGDLETLLRDEQAKVEKARKVIAPFAELASHKNMNPEAAPRLYALCKAADAFLASGEWEFMADKLCKHCGQPMMKKGQKRKHPDDYRHAQGCSGSRVIVAGGQPKSAGGKKVPKPLKGFQR